MYLENFSNVLTLWGGGITRGAARGERIALGRHLNIWIIYEFAFKCESFQTAVHIPKIVKHFTCNYQFDLCASVLFDFSRIVQTLRQTLRLRWTARYRFATRDTWIPWERHNNHTPRVSGNLSSHSATLFCLCAFVIVVVLVIFIVNVFAYLRRPHKYHVKSNNNNRNRWSVEQEKKQQNEQ